MCATAAFYFSADTRNIESQCIFFNLIELLVLLLLLIWDQYVCHRYVYFLYLFIEIPQWTIPIAECFVNTWNKGIFSLEIWYSVLSNDHVSIEWKSAKKPHVNQIPLTFYFWNKLFSGLFDHLLTTACHSDDFTFDLYFSAEFLWMCH